MRANGEVEYSIPKRGHVTRDNAKDLYYIVKGLKTYTSFKLSSALIDILLNDKLDKIDQLKNIIKEDTGPATYKQSKALNRIIFGRHYQVDTYLDLMEYFVNDLDPADILRAEKPKNDDWKNIVDLGQDTEKPIETEVELKKPIENEVELKNPFENEVENAISKRRKTDDPQYFYINKILPFLKQTAQGIKQGNLKEEKKQFTTDLLNMIRAVQ